MGMDETRGQIPENFDRTLPTVAGDGSGDFGSGSGSGGNLYADTPTLPPGTLVGQYQIESVLGVGGMGAVYLATQTKPQRRVALKLIRAGVMTPRTLQRFDLEAEILGRLQHPCIAQIYEAGIDQASGSPYFAMEYVEGWDLEEYARRLGLGVREKLGLFARLCDAIQHAHAKGIIHRDLKPGNVMVTESGEPKVLDFGIARASGELAPEASVQTFAGQLIGTLYYMSPEQANGDTTSLDTRSDVYALGVVLFELLTGELPYDLKDKAVHRAVTVIIETAPTRLSRLDSSLRGDLEIIVSKALEKDREQRYQTVADLSADVRRVLANEPILARPPSAVYRASKFVRRHRNMTIAAACVALLLGAGVGTAATQWVRRNEARRVALDSMLSSLNAMDVQKGLGADLSKRLLDIYSDNGQALFSGDRESLGDFYANLGEAYFGYEDYARAFSAYTKAHTIFSDIRRAPDPKIAQSLHGVANAEFYLGRFDDARTHYEQTLAMNQKLYPTGSKGSAETARTLDHLGSTCVKLGDSKAALAMYTQARDLRVALFGPASVEAAMSNNSIAWYHVQQGQYDVAEPIYREALGLLEALPDEDSKPVWVARAKHSLGNTLIHLQRYEEARDLLTQSLALKQALLSNNKPTVATTLESLAEVNLDLGDYDMALKYAGELVQIRQDTADPRLDSAKALLASIQSKTAN